ncbi:hypothetical protein [Curtobacterium luteum]|uniref:Aminoglycoside phosphotransferase n=1 Tax=Curtobacterium luteum TaxID=33881 RepID=A0A175RSF3_9MICO|nr:hypothetical protein [Curtobacterium luteum]KTR06427.1 hypothetical protein NS184_09610 [Curtobacterium luteum]
MTPDRPDDAVLRAFGAAGVTPVRLPGGRGMAWRVGDVVLRPDDGPTVTDWRATVLAELPHTSAFRTPRPIATTDGAWRSGSWEAWEFVPGRADERRVEDVLRAGRAFHRALAHLDRPAFLGAGSDPVRPDDAWSRADRMAWEEEPLPRDPSLDRLAAAFRPVRSPFQLVHGDLLGNVLFAGGHPPTVIDWPPYWRPAGLGSAVAAVDAVCWHAFPLGRLGALGDGITEWSQLLVRALAFRIATLHLLGAWDATAAARHRPVIDAVV